ncbi:MAG TPA: ABC transporter permease [Candidatus Methylomirabilis sp.]|nr:ABC transporter permease [Candidatus Methylomirabilis sp.]
MPELWTRRLWLRLQSLFRRERTAQRLDDELQFHLEQQIAENIAAGMSREKAHHAAMRLFGNSTLVKEDARRTWGWMWLEQFAQDVRFGARSLRKSPGFAAVAILTLALGIGANTAIFTVVNAVLLRPLPYPDANRLAVIWSGLGSVNRAVASTYELYQIRQRTKEFDQIGGIWVTNGALPGEGEPEQVKVGLVTSNFLPILCSRPAIGRFFNAEDEAPNAPWTIVISHGVWERRFGADPSIVGKSIRYGNASAVVIGVMPQDFRIMFPDSVPSNVDVFYSVPVDGSDPSGPGWLHLVGHLRPGSTFAQAQAEADTIATQIHAWDGNLNISGLRLSVIPLQADDVREVRSTLLLLFGGVGFVLLIACANVANLLMARATHRVRETTVRSSLGASRGRLVRQLLSENLLLACLGAAVALAVGWLAVRVILANRPPAMVNFNQINLDFTVLTFTFAVAILTSALFGLAPVFSAGRVDLAQTLKEGGRSALSARRRWTGLLVSAEVALGFVLLAGTGLLMRTFVNILRVDPGFRAENILTFQIPTPKYAMLHELQRNIVALPGVRSVSAVSHLPLVDAANWYANYWKEGASEEEQHTVMADHRSILPGYFNTVGATMLEGRDFTDTDDLEHQHVAIIDDVLARELWPNEDALGKKLNVSDTPKGPYQFERDWAVVVGVVRHIQCHSLTVIVRPQIYLPFQLAPRPVSIVVRTAGIVPNLAATARAQVHLLNKDMPVSQVAPLTDYVVRARSQSRFASLLAASLAVISLLLACIGIYGVLSYSVAQRTSEIGVRMAMGARRSSVLRMVLRQGFASTALGLAGGFLLSLIVMPLLAGLLFGVTPRDPMNYILISALVIGVSVLASFFPARRATEIDPIVALRHE